MAMPVQNAAYMDVSALDIVFSAIESDQAKIPEPKFARDKAVISTASAFRYDEDVPILIPEINSEHVKLIDVQIEAGRWKGFIIQIVQRNRLSISTRSTGKWIGAPKHTLKNFFYLAQRLM